MLLSKYYNSSAKTITVPKNFNNKLVNLPIDLKILIFEENLEEIDYSQFNKNIGHVNCYDDSCPRNLPDSLTVLRLGYFFDQNVDNLPKNLLDLTFGANFNQNVDNLPTKLTNLTFGDNFNQNVDNLPKKLTHLIFGLFFNKKVDNLPNSITHLTFGYEFNQMIDVLPNSLIQLTVGYNFNQKIDVLPNSIKQLGFFSNSLIKNDIYSFIKIIDIFFLNDDTNNNYLTNIPSNIEKIRINKKSKVKFIKKIPFGCTVTDFDDNILLEN
jgi:hypothetical protein